MDITTPVNRHQFNTPKAAVTRKNEHPVPSQDGAPTVVDYVSQGVGVVGGAIQVVLKTPRNAIAPFLLPPRSKGDGSDVSDLAKDPALTRAWGIASSLGGAVFMGAVAGLCIGGPIAVAIGAGVGAKLFRFVDDKLADKARADEKSPVFVDGALAKGDSIAEGASSLGRWSNAFSTMSGSSYVEVRDWYSSQVKERLES